MSMLVFGKNGQVGTALQKIAPDQQIVLTLAGRENLDLATLTNPDPILNLIDRYKPSAILNAAAYTAVDKAESEPKLAKAINTHAPTFMAEACLERGIPLVHVSTDFVFDGNATEPYTEYNPVAPLSVYGSTKLAGEDAIVSTGCTYAILRTAWVFSATGGNFVKTMLRLGAERDVMNIVADQRGAPTPADAIAIVMLSVAHQLIQNPDKSGIYHFTGAPMTTWADFARAIFKEAGLQTFVTDIPASDYPTPATRPAWSVLDCTRIRETFGIPQPDWRIALNATIAELTKV